MHDELVDYTEELQELEQWYSMQSEDIYYTDSRVENFVNMSETMQNFSNPLRLMLLADCYRQNFFLSHE